MSQIHHQHDSQILHAFLELFTPVFHVFEQVEAGAARTQQHCAAGLSHLETLIDTVLHALHVGDGKAETIEGSMKLRIIHSQEDEADALLADQVEDFRIVIALVLPPKNEDNRCAHAV